MKLLIVTSQVTYSPGNYEKLLKELLPHLSEMGWNICGVVSLKTLDFPLIKAIIGLPFMGVKDLTKNLVINSVDELLGKREKLLKEIGIKHFQWETMNSPSALDFIKEKGIDLILNIRTRCIYKEDILTSASLGCINIHHGLLPKYRGTFCDLYALSEGREAGFTIHKMEKKVDAGELYRVVTVDEGLERNYENYLASAELREIETLKEFFQEVLETKSLPQGIKNSGHECFYTKNPTKKMVKEFKRKGLIL